MVLVLSGFLKPVVPLKLLHTKKAINRKSYWLLVSITISTLCTSNYMLQFNSIVSENTIETLVSFCIFTMLLTIKENIGFSHVHFIEFT